MSNQPKFGVAGNPPNYWESEYSNERARAPIWLNSIGLDALEIQCTYGVRMPEERIKLFKKNSKKYGIELSIHGPYYISIGSSDPEKTKRSLDEIVKSVELAQKVGAKRVIFHPGGIENTREESRKNAIESLKRLPDLIDFRNVRIFPEIAGKKGQLGSLEDILEICAELKEALPCLDLAHLHARTDGSLRKEEDYENLFEKIKSELGTEALENMHIHFYPIDYGPGGEKVHKAFSDKKPKPKQIDMFSSSKPVTKYYPRYEEFLNVVYRRKLAPTVICEAKNSQDVGALEMRKYWSKILQTQ